MPASCAGVRERLAEHALGVLSEGDRDDVERHLQWCAACRKEAEDLSAGAATLAFAVPAASPPPGLAERVAEQVARIARAPSFRRRTRAAASVAIAALVAVSALGWGAVMAGRAERYRIRAIAEQRQELQSVRQFQHMFQQFSGQLNTGLRNDETSLAQLAPASGCCGGGVALELVSDSLVDFVMLRVSGLPTDTRFQPYHAWLLDAAGNALSAGRIDQLDSDGSGELFHEFPQADLSAFTRILVRDAEGKVALEGAVEPVSR
jgi:hypothetical protein